MKDLLLNSGSKEIRFAIVINGKLQDLVIERRKTRLLSGNIYKGKVTNILRNIQSAFIDINEGDNGFIHISDILENSAKFSEMFDIDFETKEKVDESDITKLLEKDQSVLVQVVKEPIGSKGARLTSNVTIAGRYLVMVPNSPHRGVSRKIQDRGARDRLKKIIKEFEMPNDMGLICRTAAVHATTEQLIDETRELVKIWEGVIEKFHKARKPTCLFQESDIVKRALMRAIDKKFDRILIDDRKLYNQMKALYENYKNEHPTIKIEYYRDKMSIFDKFGVEREVDKAMRRKIWLPSGGYLFFDRTEAMYTIDVNSGRSSSSTTGKDLEESLVRINMEAAEEIARQLRLRNVGGLIVCDFIDMRARRNQRRVLDCLKEAMKDDSAKCTVLGMSEFGLVEMTRQRSRESIMQTLFTSCPYCIGQGMIKNYESTAIEIERALKKAMAFYDAKGLEIMLHPQVENFMQREDKPFLEKVAGKNGVDLLFTSDDSLHLNDYKFVAQPEGVVLDV
ncbi:MAG: Rne/Rng family ribonuclease [Simkaniaceae bacterium]|nr:Rne/Rng family ribonuclease [Simkaniaceae bacterium]